MRLNRQRQTGDTLVEVMIAMAIITFVLSIAYSTASRSIKIGRQAQERIEALKLTEGQVEALKLMGTSSDANRALIYGQQFSRVSGTPQSFCVRVIAAPTLQAQNIVPLVLESDPLTIGASPAIYNAACAVGVAQRYKISIEREDSGAIPNVRSTFTIRTRWERLGGGKDEVSIVYRMHRSQF